MHSPVAMQRSSLSFRALVSLCLLLPVGLKAQKEAPSSSAVLLFAGDIMLAEKVGETIARGVDPFQYVAPVLKTADVTIGNLECVVSTKGTPMEGKPFTFEARPEVMPMLAKHFGIVSLANNHTGDFGREAFVEQLGLLDQHRIAHVGGGRNCMEARTPHLIEVKGIRIALLAYCDYHPREFEAGPSWPGTAWAVDEQIEADIKAARSVHHADLVIPFMHWGDQYLPVNAKQRRLAHRMIVAGADIVVGAHPHVEQGAEYYRGKLIVYSLGNFLFNGFDEGPSRVGWMLRLRVDRKGLNTWDTVVVHLDEDGTPRPVENALSPAGDARERSMNARRALTDLPLAP
jgi:poly-gamma-glutamate synthesis protein (capsule biosynthesis protein)